MSKALKVLFIPIDAVGHVNSAVGIAQVLLNAGHQCLFAINIQWRDRLKKYGIQEVLIRQDDRDPDVDPARHWADLFVSGGGIKGCPPLENAINILTKMNPEFIETIKRLDVIVDGLLRDIQPDVVVTDQVLCVPAVELSGIPWVSTCSFNPLFFIEDDRTPPRWSGLPTTGPKQEWQAFNQTVRTAQYDVWKGFSDYVVSRGLPPLPDHSFINHSKYLNIYGFPLELDYLDMRPLPPKWYRFDNLKRTEREPEFEIPVPLRDRPGKLVYFSMGSMGGADVENMQRLVNILSKSKHSFIVSKGPKHTEYDLGDNMWGAATVPQMQVLPVVDLVVTHGGNNTITETIYFGKPVVVLPLFEDQWDNAQRVHELGFGIRLDAYQCSERELLTAIDRLLSDKALNERLRKVSQRIQSDNSIAKLPEMIVNLVDNN